MRNLLRVQDYVSSLLNHGIVIIFRLIPEYSTTSPNLRRQLCTINCFSGDPCGQIQSAVLKSPEAGEKTLTHISNFLRGVNSSSLTKDLALGSKVSDFLLVSSGRETAISIACDIFKALVISSQSKSSTYYLRFATCFISVVDCGYLLHTVRNMERELPVSRARVVMNRMLYAFGKSRQLQTAIWLFSWMKSSTVGFDLVTYNIVLDVMGFAGKINEVVNEFKSMENDGISPDFITFNTLLNVFRKDGRLDLCLVYYSKMIKRGIEADLLTYTALIGSFGRSGNVEDALRLFDAMKTMEIPPSLYVYRSLIANLRKMGRLDFASAMQDKLNIDQLNLSRRNHF